MVFLSADCSEFEVKKDPKISASEFEVKRDARIPALAYRLKRVVRAETNYYWGLNQSATVFYSQIHQESNWNPEAQSKYASGLAQFTPQTAEWISKLYAKDLGENKPLDARWAIRACLKYDKFLYEKFIQSYSSDDRWRFTLSSYNGGYGWVLKDQKLTESKGRDSSKWICNVEHYSNRAQWAFKENRDYPFKILNKWYPVYETGGFK